MDAYLPDCLAGIFLAHQFFGCCVTDLCTLLQVFCSFHTQFPDVQHQCGMPSVQIVIKAQTFISYYHRRLVPNWFDFFFQ